MWFYIKCIAVLIAAIVLKSINVWLGAIFAFLVVFSFGILDVYETYKWHRFHKDDIIGIIFHLVKYFVYGVLGAALLSFSGGDDPYMNDYMEHLEPR